MINIVNYLNDGADWQAQAVLAYLKYECEIIKDEYYGEEKEFEVKIQVGRFENCREQGYVVSVFVNWQQIANYAFFQHRNSDNIVVFKSDTKTINTPSISDVYCGRDKYGYDASFKYGHIKECGDWIASDIRSVLKSEHNKLNKTVEE